ncbi:MAG TPA: NlpC/P60 family protein [Crocinitomix sp.]|nr:NlpC/P60 family protein [Crocinitomix sp.]
MKNWVVFIIIFVGFQSFSQDKKIDKLEIYYDQGHYTRVYRKANQLLANPNYDYSAMPKFYKSLAIFRLSNDLTWLKRHKNEINDAINLYRLFLEHNSAEDYIKAHYVEIGELKIYLQTLEERLKTLGYKTQAEQIHKFVHQELKQVKGYVRPKETPTNNDNPNQNANSDVSTHQSKNLREKIVAYAKQFIGVKYVWAGHSPSGFDCSGFTSYVLKHFNILLSRTASGQLEGAKKIKISTAFTADLVFFGHSGKITHVGLIVSQKGEDLTMIHASTSKGIIITNIEKSTYWKPKLKATARVV